jgi:hypothetical protein
MKHYEDQGDEHEIVKADNLKAMKKMIIEVKNYDGNFEEGEDEDVLDEDGDDRD